jgi:hypothetical protein
VRIAIEYITKELLDTNSYVEKELPIIAVFINSTIKKIILKSAATRESPRGNVIFFLFSLGTERQNSAAARDAF